MWNIQILLFRCGLYYYYFLPINSTIRRWKKQLPFPPYYYCCQVQKNCDTLWYETTYHILHTTTQPPHKHTLNCHWLKKGKQTADISCCCILREGTAEVVSWHACLRHSWFEPLPPKVHTLPPSPSISLHLKWRPDDGLRNRQIDTKSSLFELFTSFSIIKLDFFIFILLIHEMKRYPRYHWSSSESLL